MFEQPPNNTQGYPSSPNQSRNNHENGLEKEEFFLLISELHKTPALTQRELSLKLNISLGKTNYLLKELVQKGIIKIRNFSTKPGKLGKVRYLLTKKGFEEKFRLAYYFLKRKESEYNRMKEEWELLTVRTDQTNSLGNKVKTQ